MPRRRIRLTYLITDLNVGGVPLHLYRMVTHLPRDRFDIHVISLADVGPVGARMQAAGVRVSACGAKTVKDVSALVRLWWLLFRDSPDILHSFLFHANMAARSVGLLAGVPISRVICEIQTAERERLWHLFVDSLTCRLCRVEIGNSVSVVGHLHRVAGIPATRLHHISSGGVDVDAMVSAEPADRKKLRMPEDVPLVVWSGRLDPIKGFEEMLAAFRRVRFIPAAHLLLIGDGPYRPVIERLVQENGLAGRVRLLGQRDDVASILRAADVFLFCSRTEGLPNALLEAMGVGLPIISTDAPGCRDLIEHGKTGLVAPVRSVGRIAELLQYALHNPEQARSLGNNAQVWVRENYGLKSMVASWNAFYDSILTVS